MIIMLSAIGLFTVVILTITYKNEREYRATPHINHQY